MSWNYRLVKRPVGNPGDGFFTYGIHEAYYNADGEVWGLTQDPVQLSSDHINELKIDWLMLMEAFVAPVLDYDEVCNNSADPPFNLPKDDEDDFDEMDSGISLDEYGIHEELDLDLEPYDPNAYTREMTEKNEQEEFQHAEEYVGSPPEQIHALIKALRSQNP